jgi:hypothetical protein
VDRQSQPSSLGRSRNTQATANGGSGSCCASITGCANPGFQS